MRRTSRRTLIEPEKGDKRQVRRKQNKQVKTEPSAGRALAIDRPHKAKNEASASVARETKRRHALKRDG